MPITAESLEAENARLRQENERLWRENNVLRPQVSDLHHKLGVAIRHLQTAAKAETETIVRRDPEDHG